MPQQKQVTAEAVVNLIVWLNDQERIASFHSVDGYERKEFLSHEHFIGFLQALTCSGYRFM